MNTIVIIGIWVLCGCIMSFLVYLADDDKSAREEIYTSNLYILFIILFWPMAAYFFLRLLIAAVSKTPGGGND